jgi:hypothetical protein
MGRVIVAGEGSGDGEATGAGNGEAVAVNAGTTSGRACPPQPIRAAATAVPRASEVSERFKMPSPRAGTRRMSGHLAGASIPQKDEKA